MNTDSIKGCMYVISFDRKRKMTTREKNFNSTNLKLCTDFWKFFSAINQHVWAALPSTGRLGVLYCSRREKPSYIDEANFNGSTESQ